MLSTINIYFYFIILNEEIKIKFYNYLIIFIFIIISVLNYSTKINNFFLANYTYFLFIYIFKKTNHYQKNLFYFFIYYSTTNLTYQISFNSYNLKQMKVTLLMVYIFKIFWINKLWDILI